MDFPVSIIESRAAIVQFLVDQAAGLQDEIREPLQDLAVLVSPVDQISDLAEFLYANKERVGQQGRNLCAKLARFADGQGWKFTRDGRGTKMAWAMMRRNGLDAPEGVTFQAAEDDPPHRAEFKVDVPEVPEA